MSQKSRSIQKKYFLALLLSAGMLFGAPTNSKAIDFKAKGQWLIGFGLGNANLGSGEVVHKDDLFSAAQRFRLQLDAIASEQLSGTIFFEIGTQDWGDNRRGGALGADGDNAVKIKNAYIDWIVPETDLTLRMGLQIGRLPPGLPWERQPSCLILPSIWPYGMTILLRSFPLKCPRPSL